MNEFCLSQSFGILKSHMLNHLREATAYIQREPAKSMLIAAATGAALMALLSLLTSVRSRR